MIQMRYIIYFISLAILSACSAVNDSNARKHHRYVRKQKLNVKSDQAYHPNKHEPSAEEIDADFEEGLYKMLLNMTVEQRREFSRAFIFTEQDIQSIDSLLRKL